MVVGCAVLDRFVFWVVGDQLLKGGDSGPAILPGAPEKSLLIKAVRYGNKDLQMPPKHQLTAREIELLEQWVKMGAPDPRTNTASMQSVKAASTHWAFQPVSDPCIPTVRNARWPSRPTDNFILAKLEANGLSPNFAADKRTLLRRASLDLTGLLPTSEELDQFLADRSPLAFDEALDRLLASPRYGERWARHWLDLARYAENPAGV